LSGEIQTRTTGRAPDKAVGRLGARRAQPSLAPSSNQPVHRDTHVLSLALAAQTAPASEDFRRLHLLASVTNALSIRVATTREDAHALVQQHVVLLVLTDHQRRSGVMYYCARWQRVAKRSFSAKPMPIGRLSASTRLRVGRPHNVSPNVSPT
jgi:hypothetical protein